jgi:ABC-type glycerol-3-phosphate transport system substrate-binding protein
MNPKPKMRRSRFRPKVSKAGVALLAALTLALTACAGDAATTTTTSQQGTTTSSPQGATTTAAAPSDEPVTIALWVNREQYLPPDSYYAALAETNPNITVEAELVPDDDLFFQLVRMNEVGEEMPDVVQLDDYFAVPMLDSGIEEPMDDLIATWQEEDPEGFAKISPNAFFTNEEGHVVGVTPIANMDVLYMRSDWLTQAGITELPTSWDGVLDALRAIKASQPDILPIALNAARGTSVPWFLSLLGATGTPFSGSVPDLESEGGLYTIGWLQQAVSEGLTDVSALAWTDDETRGAYIGGAASMIYDSMRSTNDLGGELIASGVEYGDGWVTSSAPLRLTDDGEDVGQHLLGTRTYHVTVGTEHPYEAGVALRALFTEEQAYESLEVSNTPLQPAVIQSDIYAEKQPFITQDQKDAILAAVQRPADSHFFEVVEILEQVVQDIYQNPDTPTAEIAAKWQAELDALG